MTIEGQQSRALVAGTSGPIGETMASALEAVGYEVVRLDRETRVNSTDLQIDLCSSDLLATLNEEVTRNGSFRHLVHAAGGSREMEARSPQWVPDLAEVETTLRDNLLSALSLLRWVDQSTSVESLTIVSSINALRSFGMPAYSASKAGLRGLLAASTPSLARRGIRLNLLTLGTIEHPAVISRHNDERHFANLHQAAPLGHFALLKDVGAAIRFIVETPGVCGAEIIVDAGQRWTT